MLTRLVQTNPAARYVATVVFIGEGVAIAFGLPTISRSCGRRWERIVGVAGVLVWHLITYRPEQHP